MMRLLRYDPIFLHLSSFLRACCLVDASNFCAKYVRDVSLFFFFWRGQEVEEEGAKDGLLLNNPHQVDMVELVGLMRLIGGEECIDRSPHPTSPQKLAAAPVTHCTPHLCSVNIEMVV